MHNSALKIQAVRIWRTIVSLARSNDAWVTIVNRPQNNHKITIVRCKKEAEWSAPWLAWHPWSTRVINPEDLSTHGKAVVLLHLGHGVVCKMRGSWLDIQHKIVLYNNLQQKRIIAAEKSNRQPRSNKNFLKQTNKHKQTNVKKRIGWLFRAFFYTPGEHSHD